MSKSELIPLPFEKRYAEMGPVRQKMGRILLYLIQKYSSGLGRHYTEYAACHKLIYAAWKRLNEDTEFCEQVELDLPAPPDPPDPPGRSPRALACSAGLRLHQKTYLTKEMLLKAVESYKQASEANPMDEYVVWGQ